MIPIQFGSEICYRKKGHPKHLLRFIYSQFSSMLVNNYVMQYALPIFQEDHAIQYTVAKFYNALPAMGTATYLRADVTGTSQGPKYRKWRVPPRPSVFRTSAFHTQHQRVDWQDLLPRTAALVVVRNDRFVRLGRGKMRISRPTSRKASFPTPCKNTVGASSPKFWPTTVSRRK
jgi:hypothetical protein